MSLARLPMRPDVEGGEAPGGMDVIQKSNTDAEVETRDSCPNEVGASLTDDDEYVLAPVPFPIIVVLEAALAPGALLLGWLLGQHPLDQFQWSGRALLLGALATLPMFALLALTLRWPYGPLRRIKNFFDEELRPALANAHRHDLVLLSLAAGLGEEMLFRGVIQGATIGWFGTIFGVVAASSMFGLLHPVSPAYVVLAALLGAYLGVVLLLDGNLLTVVTAHALYDFVALTVLLRKSGNEADSA